jgi:monoamine oxidase
VIALSDLEPGGHILSRSESMRRLRQIVLKAQNPNTENKFTRSIARREFLKTTGALTASLAGVQAFGMPRAGAAGSSASIGIVGAGLAGLTAAYDLYNSGFSPTIYEANSRVGGRQYSLRGFFPGQVAERGGELIDTGHKTIINFARTFGLHLESYIKQPGELFYYFYGQRYSEDQVVAEFRAFVDAMRVDVRTLSNRVTARNNTPFDVRLDKTTLEEYLRGNNSRREAASPVAYEAIRQAYIAEYGRELHEQSALNFLQFIHVDKRAKFSPFGSSDERFHIVEGNDAVALNLANRVASLIQLGQSLVAIRKVNGRIDLTLQTAGGTKVETHDVVILAIPFSILRLVQLDSSLQIPPAKMLAIQTLGYGDNAKMMIGFTGRPWRAVGSNGSSYTNLPNVQTTWETNGSLANSQRAILTDYSGGVRGANLAQVQNEALKFLIDLDKVYPGSSASATRTVYGAYLAHLEHWPSNPLTRGSYTCYLPGQFTSIGGLEGEAVGNLLFAGEHTDSFYAYQGFMEGACLSGLRAASEVKALVGKK